jgi:hypothetical protein
MRVLAECPGRPLALAAAAEAQVLPGKPRLLPALGVAGMQVLAEYRGRRPALGGSPAAPHELPVRNGAAVLLDEAAAPDGVLQPPAWPAQAWQAASAPTRPQLPQSLQRG